MSVPPEQGDTAAIEAEMSLASGIAAFESKLFRQATALLGPLAADGVAEAQYRMAIMAQNGLGMATNEANAFTWMRAAAESGYDMAQHGLGFMYMEGECTTKAPELAVHWFRRAAEQGLTGSQATLGMMYREGRGVAKDLDEARKWFQMAGFDEEFT